MFFKLLFIFFNIIQLNCYNLNLDKFKSKHVHLNIEKFNSKYNLMHVAVTFSDPICSVNRKICRFDFRIYNDGNSYLTNRRQRLDLNYIFPNINLPNTIDCDTYNLYRNNIDIYSKSIYWGTTNKTWAEIFDYEEKFLCKRYILGIYDCRHYTALFTKFATGIESPIWTLDELWDAN